jgi:2-polyprenyl-3-methyl-5-hydroxy-6-metoxy-1,4-benzoquinol methylase
MTGIDYADTYDPDTDFDRFYTIATARKIAETIKTGQRVLELGCATGLMTSIVLDRSAPQSWLGVDRSDAFLERARARGLAAARFAVADLDALACADLDRQVYDHVLATNVLHELADPVEFLRACGDLITPTGLIHVSLQNPYSIHRVCALEMGLIGSLEEISERGSQWGTRGLWTAAELRDLGAQAGLNVHIQAGIMLKPLPNSLMSQLPDDVIEGFIRGAAQLPDSCAMNYLAFGHG